MDQEDSIDLSDTTPAELCEGRLHEHEGTPGPPCFLSDTVPAFNAGSGIPISYNPSSERASEYDCPGSSQNSFPTASGLKGEDQTSDPSFEPTAIEGNSSYVESSEPQLKCEERSSVDPSDESTPIEGDSSNVEQSWPKLKVLKVDEINCRLPSDEGCSFAPIVVNVTNSFYLSAMQKKIPKINVTRIDHVCSSSKFSDYLKWLSKVAKQRTEARDQELLIEYAPSHSRASKRSVLKKKSRKRLAGKNEKSLCPTNKNHTRDSPQLLKTKHSPCSSNDHDSNLQTATSSINKRQARRSSGGKTPTESKKMRIQRPDSPKPSTSGLNKNSLLLTNTFSRSVSVTPATDSGRISPIISPVSPVSSDESDFHGFNVEPIESDFQGFNADPIEVDCPMSPGGSSSSGDFHGFDSESSDNEEDTSEVGSSIRSDFEQTISEQLASFFAHNPVYSNPFSDLKLISPNDFDSSKYARAEAQLRTLSNWETPIRPIKTLKGCREVAKIHKVKISRHSLSYIVKKASTTPKKKIVKDVKAMNVDQTSDLGNEESALTNETSSSVAGCSNLNNESSDDPHPVAPYFPSDERIFHAVIDLTNPCCLFNTIQDILNGVLPLNWIQRDPSVVFRLLPKLPILQKDRLGGWISQTQLFSLISCKIERLEGCFQGRNVSLSRIQFSFSDKRNAIYVSPMASRILLETTKSICFCSLDGSSKSNVQFHVRNKFSSTPDEPNQCVFLVENNNFSAVDTNSTTVMLGEGRKVLFKPPFKKPLRLLSVSHYPTVFVRPEDLHSQLETTVNENSPSSANEEIKNVRKDTSETIESPSKILKSTPTSTKVKKVLKSDSEIVASPSKRLENGPSSANEEIKNVRKDTSETIESSSKILKSTPTSTKVKKVQKSDSEIVASPSKRLENTLNSETVGSPSKRLLTAASNIGEVPAMPATPANRVETTSLSPAERPGTEKIMPDSELKKDIVDRSLENCSRRKRMKALSKPERFGGFKRKRLDALCICGKMREFHNLEKENLN